MSRWRFGKQLETGSCGHLERKSSASEGRLGHTPSQVGRVMPNGFVCHNADAEQTSGPCDVIDDVGRDGWLMYASAFSGPLDTGGVRLESRGFLGRYRDTSSGSRMQTRTSDTSRAR